jgi:hypothetical protein
MYLIRKDDKYYLTYSKEVVDKFNSEHNGYMCDVTLLEEHNIPEKEEPPKYIAGSGKFFGGDVLIPTEYTTVTLSAGEITSGRPLQMTTPFTYSPFIRYDIRPTITTSNITSGATS